MDETKQNNNLFDKVNIGTKNYQELYERGLKLIKTEPEPKKLMKICHRLILIHQN